MSLGMPKGGRYVNDRLNDYIIYKQGGSGGAYSIRYSKCFTESTIVLFDKCFKLKYKIKT